MNTPTAALTDTDEYLRRGREESERVVAETIRRRAERLRRERLAERPGKHRPSYTGTRPSSAWRTEGRHREPTTARPSVVRRLSLAFILTGAAR